MVEHLFKFFSLFHRFFASTPNVFLNPVNWWLWFRKSIIVTRDVHFRNNQQVASFGKTQKNDQWKILTNPLNQN
ncbi:MAG: hypothetical protein MRECE_8c056 [Mycoplasmataceae bacterium CE_OT135]|nr:MAG: hypothetical protein MRECE_8c056 [Mycoplasmataceae bacterium CE_OT135]